MNATTLSITQGNTRTFTATVSGTADTAVTWSVLEPGGGVVDPSGTYTAPATSGTYHLTATSHANSAISATAALTVVAPPNIASFETNRDEILTGQSISLTAVFSDGTAVVDHGVGAVVSGVPAKLVPTGSSVYILTVTNTAGTSITSGVAVRVDTTVGIGVAPTGATVPRGQTQSFLAVVTGTMNDGVTWRVKEASGGTITAQGLYTAPATGGIYHVEATSVMDPAKKATATVQVPTPAWGIAAPINDKFGTGQSPSIASDGLGNAIAVWNQHDGTAWSIFSNRFVVGSGWGTPTALESNAIDAHAPQVACDDTGIAHAVWLQNDGGGNHVWANRYVPGIGWGTAKNLEMNLEQPFNAQVACDNRGNAIAVWATTVSPGTFRRIWASHYSPGTGWGLSAVIAEDTMPRGDDLKLAFDGNGNALVVYGRQVAGYQFYIWAQRFVVGTGWGAATLLQSTLGDTSYPQIACDNSGNAIAVWTQSDGAQTHVWTNHYSTGTGWGTATLLETSTYDATTPQVAFDGTGNATAVWAQSNGKVNSIWARRYTAGVGWGGTTILDSGVYNAGLPQIAFDASGNATSVWSQSDGIRYNIWANRFDVGTGWGMATLLETENAGDAFGSPRITVDGNGNAHAIWAQYTIPGIRIDIWANEFR